MMLYDKNNIFAKILRGEIPCKKIFENEHVLSLISPEEFEFSQRKLGKFVNSVRLLGDHTWHIIK